METGSVIWATLVKVMAKACLTPVLSPKGAINDRPAARRLNRTPTEYSLTKASAVMKGLMKLGYHGIIHKL